MNDDNQMVLDEIDENQRPDTRDSKRLKGSPPAPLIPYTPAPRLPEIGGSLGDGEIGWDEQWFKG